MEEKDKVEATQTSEETQGSAPSQEKDPIQAELERVESQKPKRTKLETLQYNAEKWNRDLAEERKKQGIEEDDNRPLTVAEFKSMQRETAQETALTLADDIQDEAERKLVKHHLEQTIKPSGDPQTDLRNARSLVNAVRNTQIAAEAVRAGKPKAAGSAASAPPREKQADDLTAEEKKIMTGFKLTKEQVIASRPQE